jgi:CBS domain-containing protein
MQVREIMTSEVVTVQPDTPITLVARLFREEAFSGLPVVDEEGELVGIITEVDIIARHARPHFPSYFAFLDSVIYLESPRRYRESMRHILATTARELMTSPVQTVDPEMDVQDLATLMVEKRVNPVPVLDEEGRLVGIVSHTDLLQMIEEAETASETEQEGGEKDKQEASRS